MKVLLLSFVAVFLTSLGLQATQNYDVTIRVTDQDGDYDEKPFTILVQEAPPLEGFAGWAAQIPDPQMRDHADDPDGDGLPNLLEYAFNFSPTIPQSGGTQPVVSLANGKISITFVRDVGKSDIVYLVEGSESLANWSEVIYNSSSPAPEYSVNNAGPAMQVWDTEQLTSPNVRRFLRVKVLSVP